MLEDVLYAGSGLSEQVGSVWTFARWRQVNHEMSAIHPEDWGDAALRCDAGHPLTRENVYHYAGQQRCRACRAERERERIRRRNAEAPSKAKRERERIRRRNAEAPSKAKRERDAAGLVVSCRAGHPYTPENTAWARRPDGKPFKQCVQCRREQRSARRRVAQDSANAD